MDLNIRDFPGALGRKLKAEAALRGISLKKYVIDSLRLVGNQETQSDEAPKRLVNK